MNKNLLGSILLRVGLVILLVSLLSDLIALPKFLGLGHDPEFGPYQIIGVIVGIILGGTGWFLRRQKSDMGK